MIVPDIHIKQNESAQPLIASAPSGTPSNPLGSGVSASNFTAPATAPNFLDNPFADVKVTESGETTSASKIEARVAATISQDLNDVPLVLFGVPCRRITLASITLLYDIKSPFAIGGDFSKVENPLLEVGKFVALQTGKLKDAMRLADDPSALRLAAMEIMDRVSGVNVPDAVKKLIEEMKKATETQVKAELPPGRKEEKVPLRDLLDMEGTAGNA